MPAVATHPEPPRAQLSDAPNRPHFSSFSVLLLHGNLFLLRLISVVLAAFHGSIVHRSAVLSTVVLLMLHHLLVCLLLHGHVLRLGHVVFLAVVSFVTLITILLLVIVFVELLLLLSLKLLVHVLDIIYVLHLGRCHREGLLVEERDDPFLR